MKYRLLCLVAIVLVIFFTEAYGGQLTPISVTPRDNRAGISTNYTFTFTTSSTGNGVNVGIPADGKIVITFPGGFDVSEVEISSSVDANVLNGGLNASAAGGIITVTRDSTGAPVAGNTTVGIRVGMIRNHTLAASNYAVTIETQLKNGTIIDSGSSATFAIMHGELATFQFSSIPSQTAGNSFGISITAKDAYNNNVLSFNTTAALSDLTASLTPTETTNFNNGVWNGTVTITKAFSSDKITVMAQNKAGTSNEFAVTPNTLHHFAVQNIASPQTAGSAFGLQVTAEDVYGNQVTSFNGTATLSDNTGTIFPTTTGAFNSGQWNGNVTITKKQKDVRITISSNGITSQSNQFNVQAGAVDHFVVDNIAAQTAGVPFVIEVTAKDQFNNQVDQFEETVNLSDDTGTITPAISDSFALGYWAGSVTITQVRTNDIIRVQRTANGVQSGSSNGFNISHNSLDHFTFATIPTNQTAGNSFNINITAKDAYENTVANFNGTASLSDLTNSISPTITTNFGNGIWSGNVTITRSFTSNRISATAGSKTGSSNSFNVNPYNLDHFRFQTITSPHIAGQSFTITITAEDIYNNRVTSFTNTVNLSDPTGTIFPTTSGNFSTGQWTGNVQITKSANDITITATRSTTTGQSNPFNIEPAMLDHFSLATIGTKAAGVPFAIVVTAQDFYNNRVTNFNGTVSIQDLTGSIAPTNSGPFDLGQWSGDVTITQVRTADRITVTNTAGLESGTSNNFDVVAGNIDHFEIANITTPKTAGVPFSVTITAKDANNATVTGYNGTVNLSDLTGTLSPLVTPNFNNGVWTGDLTITRTYTNNKITASGAGKSGTSNAFNVQPNSLTHFTFTNITSPKTAGQSFAISIAARDNYENVVTSFQSTVNLSDNTNTISPTSTPNFSDGQWTGNVTITRAQNDVEITATQGSVSGTSNKFNVQAAALHHFSINNISTQQSGVPFNITVMARDQYNNVATQFAAKVNISDKTNTITPTASDNFANGQWSGNVTISQSYTSNSITVTRQGGTETGTSNNFDVTSSAVDHFVISPIGNQVAGQSFSVTIRAEDAANNLVTSFNGTASISDLTSSITPKTTGSFNNGQWTGRFSITKSRIGDTITASSGGKIGVSNTFNVDPAALDHFRIATISSPQIAGTAFTITITAEDIYNNKATGFTGVVNLSDNTGSLTPATSGSFNSGEWTGAVTITKTATDNVINVSGSGKSGQSNAFNVNAATLHHFILNTISTQAAGAPFAITVTAQDNYGNTATQFTGKVTISDKTNTITPTVSGNFSNGQWTGNVSIAQAYASDIITVTRQGGSENGASNSFDVISSNVDHFVISSIGNQVAGQPFSITIRAEDSNNNLVTNFTGTASLSDLTNTINPTTTGSFSGGQWSGSVTITKSRTGNNITATSGGKAGTSNSFNVNPAALDHFRLSTIGSPQIAGQAFSITITAEDVYNNKVTGFTSSVSLSESTNSITPTASPNFVSGEWTGLVTITKSYTDNIITATGSGKTGQSNKFNINAASLHHFVIGTISTQAAGVPFAITVTAQDNYGNTATQFTGKVNISDKTNTISPTESGNFSSGRWTGNVLISQANTNDVITVVRQGGSESGSSNGFDVISSSVDHFVIGTIGNQVAGQSFTITVRAEDKNNNLVTSFTGTATLSDLTSTISPTTTPNFVNGQWSGNVSITKSRTGNTITVTSSGKAGTSNAFNVAPGALDHFRIQPISSPQVAGISFAITIIAEDAYNNQVTSFAATASLSDATGTISPTATGNFVNGSWSGSVTITRSQSDVTITASQSGKSGQSNVFNVNPGALASFQIGTISTQSAGQPFAITVTGLDAYANVATQFTGTVNISDLTGTIAPTISGNFTAGKWTGNVTITQVRTNDRITVTNTGGSQTGQSNLFNVIASAVDHFVIDNITSPKTAGVAFSLTITAKDKDNNTVTGFAGTATLSDLTGTISPTTTTNFVNGIWTGNVTITRSLTNNSITVTSSGKAGQSNTFTVIHSALDHFEFASISTPQVAGISFPITIKARDIYSNLVTSFSSSVTLTDNTQTISPSSSANFNNGEWTGNVRITKKQNDVYIVASGSGKIGQSNYFNVKAGNLSSLKITTAAGGTGQEVGPLNLSLRDKINLYATGYDSYNNYVRDVVANWRATGNLDQPSPTKGQMTVFDPRTPGTTGKIHADTTGVAADSTGQITVGSIASVKIRTAANGAGLELGDITINADQNLTLYAAGYDAGKNYIGDVSVQWRSVGSLVPAVSDTGKILSFAPTKAPATGRIIADHPAAVDDSTGIITIVPGAAFGPINLTATPSVIPANGTSTSIITSDKIKDAEGNTIAKSTQFNVSTTLGTITTTDVNPILPGIQIAANDSGQIQFTLKSALTGGTAFISVNAVNASATGSVTVYINNLNIQSISSPKTAVSQGQTNIAVNVIVENQGTSTVNNLTAGLIFIGPQPLFENRNADFPSVVRTDGVTSIPGGSTRTLLFSVGVSATAKTDTITVDSWISGQIGSVSVNDTFAITKLKWAVQTPPQLRILKVSSLLNEVTQGRAGVNVTMTVANNGMASANITLDTLSFYSVSTAKDVTKEYAIQSLPTTPVVIPGGGQKIQYNYVVNVSSAATLGPVIINGLITGTDYNSGTAIFDNAADTTFTWTVKTAPIVGITELSTSQSNVTKNQTMPWRLKMVVQNNGATGVRLDAADAFFFLGGSNISSEYTVVNPTTFVKSKTNQLAGTSTDTLYYVINKTGASVGQVTIRARIYLTDLASGNQLPVQETYTGIMVQEPAQLKIATIIPSQNSVTRNQGQDWNVKVVLANEGGTDIVIDFLPAKTYITFSTGNDFILKRPSVLNSGSTTLIAGKTDTLTYIVDGTSMTTGNCLISARVLGRQKTSGDSTVATLQRSTPVIIEEPARIRILSTINRTANPPFVNQGQEFPILVTLENNGQDEIREATIRMTSSGRSISGFLTAKITDILGSGGKKEHLFTVKADTQITAGEVFTVKIDKAEAQNTKEAAGVLREQSPDSTETVIIQKPASLQITAIQTPDTIRASQVEPWPIRLVVRNRGEAPAQFKTPTAADLIIKVNDVDHKDYIIEPPSKLQGGSLILGGGKTDTLVYIVRTTGENAGNASIDALLQANDINNQQLIVLPARSEFYIVSTAAVQLLNTEPICFNYDGEKGLVNRGQNFLIRLAVQNLGRKRVKDVAVKLTTTGGSIIAQDQLLISSIEHNETRWAEFQITANPQQNDFNEVFTSNILSAIEFDTGLPAAIGVIDNKARVEVQDSAKLKLELWPATNDTVYTINQSFTVRARVTLLGQRPAAIDDSGLLKLFVPGNYQIIPGENPVGEPDVLAFKADQIVEWQIQTPEAASGPDTIRAIIYNQPRDKNIDQKALVVQAEDTIRVRTLATSIFYTSGITTPEGAADRILSTGQYFEVQSQIQFSDNLKNVKATLRLPVGVYPYRFKSAADSTQLVDKAKNQGRVLWGIFAPEKQDNDFRPLTITITADEKGSPRVYHDTLWVRTVTRANLEIAAGISNPEAARTTGRVSISRPFTISAAVKNIGIAEAVGFGELELRLGATGCTFWDSTETAIKTFRVDSTISWKLKAPNFPTATSDITVRFIKLPKDENTSEAAYVDEGKDRVAIPITTVTGGNVNLTAVIQSPPGALDGILSSSQTFVVAANVTSSQVVDLRARLILPAAFSFGDNVNPIQILSAGESSVQWGVRAAADSISNRELKVVCFGKDSNDETVTIISDTARIMLSIIRRAEVEVIADIVSPPEATDNAVSVNQAFTVQAHLENYGQANFIGDYHLELVLPAGQGYTTADSLRRIVSGHNPVNWLINAPARATTPSNIEVKVRPKEGPLDENSNEEAAFWQEIRRDIISIVTNQKTVRIASLDNRTPSTVVRNQVNVPMLGLEISNLKEDLLSNSILLNGFRLTIKDRQGNLISQPEQIISRIAVVDYGRPEMIYGAVTDFSAGSMVPLYLSEPLAIAAGVTDSVELVIDIAAEPTLEDVMLSIQADTNIYIQEALTNNKPRIEGADQETGINLKLESDFCLIKGDNLKDFFRNYPNPFGSPQRPLTTIAYYLSEDTDVEIKIYTLIGELVWSRKFRADEPQGRKGPHAGDLTWDARNDNGHKVLNGVYVIYLKTGTGESVMTKAAVIK